MKGTVLLDWRGTLNRVDNPVEFVVNIEKLGYKVHLYTNSWPGDFPNELNRVYLSKMTSVREVMAAAGKGPVYFADDEGFCFEYFVDAAERSGRVFRGFRTAKELMYTIMLREGLVEDAEVE